MKKIIIALVLVVAVIGASVGYKMMATGVKITPTGGITGGNSSNYTFEKPGPFTVPPVGGYQLSTVDLGEGSVPLLRIPLDTWGGYAALFAANGGMKPNKDSLFYKRGKFAVELVLVEDSTEQMKGYASGKYPVIWAPMDSLPILYDAFRNDKRVQPKVLGLFDWSSGDGIIVRNSIKNPVDLKGKMVLTSSNTPYSFILLWYLAQNGLTGNDVKVVWIDDGDKALEVFKKDKNFAAWVSWAPYINDVTNSSSSSYVEDTRLLISSKDANQLIADTYIVRNDLLQDKFDMMTVFVECMAEASQLVGNTTYNDMATFYSLKNAGEAKSMLEDVHIANFTEMNMFFDMENPIGAYKIFSLAQEYYKQIGVLGADASYDPERVLVAKVMASIAKTGKFASQRNNIIDSFNKKAAMNISDLEDQRVVLTQSINLFFEAQKLDFDVASSMPEIKQNMSDLYKVSEQTKFLATTIVKLVGYLDTTKVEEFKSRGNQAYFEAASNARMLSKKRAEFVKSVLIKKYGIDPDRVITEGRGWDNPIDDKDHTKNRRVEVRFISFE